MEAIVVFVGFLGAGKTTLMKKVVKEYVDFDWSPFVILNDYENANLDAQDFFEFLPQDKINALSGSCICCSGINELRQQVNRISKREKGITLIEANGTTDAASLMGFLGVGMEDHFLPPVQIAVVDVRNWQKREWNNELEANQVQVATIVVLNYVDAVEIERVVQVEQDLRAINPQATILHWDKLDITSFPELQPTTNEIKKMDHKKAHWASCSVDLPDPVKLDQLKYIIETVPEEILRVKGCTRVDDAETYTYFERTPFREIFMRPYNGTPVMGPKLLTIGPGSDPIKLNEIIEKSGELNG